MKSAALQGMRQVYHIYDAPGTRAERMLLPAKVNRAAGMNLDAAGQEPLACFADGTALSTLPIGPPLWALPDDNSGLAEFANFQV